MRKVMLVEDEEFILQGIRSIVDWEALHMQVVHMAHNGEEALALQRQEPADIIVTDIQMPARDGLSMMEELRETDRRTRFIILTGYDEFEYARKAVPLDVEDYILKPIDEQKLQDVLAGADGRLAEIDRKNAESLDGAAGWLNFLQGRLNGEEAAKYEEIFPLHPSKPCTYAGVMKISGAGENSTVMTDVLVCLQGEENGVRVIRLTPDSLLLLLPFAGEEDGAAYEAACGLQRRLEEGCGVSTFISLSRAFHSADSLPERYREAVKLQRCRIVEGGGSCVDRAKAAGRTAEEPQVDTQRLRRLVLKKEKGGGCCLCKGAV